MRCSSSDRREEREDDDVGVEASWEVLMAGGCPPVIVLRSVHAPLGEVCLKLEVDLAVHGQMSMFIVLRWHCGDTHCLPMYVGEGGALALHRTEALKATNPVHYVETASALNAHHNHAATAYSCNGVPSPCNVNRLVLQRRTSDASFCILCTLRAMVELVDPLSRY